MQRTTVRLGFVSAAEEGDHYGSDDCAFFEIELKQDQIIGEITCPRSRTAEVIQRFGRRNLARKPVKQSHTVVLAFYLDARDPLEAAALIRRKLVGIHTFDKTSLWFYDNRYEREGLEVQLELAFDGQSVIVYYDQGIGADRLAKLLQTLYTLELCTEPPQVHDKNSVLVSLNYTPNSTQALANYLAIATIFF